MEPRTLKAAVKFYCNKDFEDAHNALADVRATVDVLKGQLVAYDNVDLIDVDGNVIKTPIKNDIQVIHDFTKDDKTIDATQRLRYDTNGIIVFNFGKYMGQPVAPILYKDRQYYNWILNKEFSSEVKQMVKQILKDYEKEKES